MSYLVESKVLLFTFYEANYAQATSALTKINPAPVQSGSRKLDSEKVNFTSRYKKSDRRTVHELEEYFKLQAEDFDQCDPLAWWYSRRGQFPNLYRLFSDVFSIPGMTRR